MPRRLRPVNARAVYGKLVLNNLPEFRIDDGIVLAGVNVTLVRNLTPIEPVLQQQVERAARELLTAREPAAGPFATLAANVPTVKLGPKQRDGAQLLIWPANFRLT